MARGWQVVEAEDAVLGGLGRHTGVSSRGGGGGTDRQHLRTVPGVHTPRGGALRTVSVVHPLHLSRRCWHFLARATRQKPAQQVLL